MFLYIMNSDHSTSSEVTHIYLEPRPLNEFEFLNS
ncbi:hypothetical protein F383_28260 [Gossypium arboreum]|uniref:Uncharacterized protein n=1 Tax=Gossypium arboreum TaxID=29729 RepID=A0A0B0P5T7_GOSAR|nr:hypothetical protein F383_28260 [Gossypium arboreum]